MASIKADADWLGAAGALVDSLVRLPDEEQRVQLMQRCCVDLGDDLYPAFLKLLCAIGRFGDDPAKAIVAETLAQGLATARLPSGQLTAWGARPWPAGGLTPPDAAVRARTGWRGHGRSLGPVEYLCVWFHQRAEGALTEASFARASRLLAGVVASSPKAAALYAAKLRGDAEDPLEGTYSRETRRLLCVFADGLQAGLPADQIVNAVVATARSIQAETTRARWAP